MQQRMQVLGHRGWPVASAHPENTVAAFTAALDAGADGVEVDVQLTRDGVAVCFHDDELDRVTDATGLLSERTWAQLQQVRLPGGHRVPLLREVLAAAAGRGQVVLDLKPERRTAALVRAVSAAVGPRRRPPGGLVVRPARARRLRPRPARPVARPAVRRRAATRWRAVRECVADGSAGLHLALDTALAAPEALRAARRAGVRVRVWTVNRLVDAQLLELLGAQAVITDHPAALAAGLRTPALVG